MVRLFLVAVAEIISSLGSLENPDEAGHDQSTPHSRHIQCVFFFEMKKAAVAEHRYHYPNFTITLISLIVMQFCNVLVWPGCG